MADVSNKTLATLLVAAIVVSLVGTLISLDKLGSLISVTGMQTTNDTDTGTTEVTIVSYAGLEVRHNINFGSGSVPDGLDSYTVDTTKDNSADSDFNDCSLGTSCRGMDVENIGNVPINVTVSFANNASSLIGGTLDNGPQLNISSVDGDYAGNNDGCTGSELSWTSDITAATEYNICDTLGYGTGQNFVNLEVSIRIPGDALNGTKSTTVTFTGAEI